MAALDALLQAPGHVVAQVVEAELVVGAVGHVRVVLLAPFLRRHLGEDHAHLEAEEVVNPPHPFGVALGQVVVDRDHVHAVARERVEVGGQHRGERLALTGLHLGDVAAVQRGAAHELHIEVPLPEGAGGRLADGGESLREQVIKRLALGEPLLELHRHGPQLGVAHRGEIFFDRVDLVGYALEPAQYPALACAQDLIDDNWHFSSRSSSIAALGRAAALHARSAGPGRRRRTVAC